MIMHTAQIEMELAPKYLIAQALGQIVQSVTRQVIVMAENAEVLGRKARTEFTNMDYGSLSGVANSQAYIKGVIDGYKHAYKAALRMALDGGLISFEQYSRLDWFTINFQVDSAMRTAQELYGSIWGGALTAGMQEDLYKRKYAPLLKTLPTRMFTNVLLVFLTAEEILEVEREMAERKEFNRRVNKYKPQASGLTATKLAQELDAFGLEGYTKRSDKPLMINLLCHLEAANAMKFEKTGSVPFFSTDEAKAVEAKVLSGETSALDRLARN